MLDAHCHLDRYQDPSAIASQAERQKVLLIAVTNLPSHFQLGLPHTQKLRNVRLALGLHPLAAPSHAAELPLFRDSLALTSYVGEVGLDFSREGQPLKEIQIASFRSVISLVAQNPKFVSLHSRRAESAVLDILAEFSVRPAVFHWFSGSLATLDRAILEGHYFSINPAMAQSANGKRIVERIPPDRALTETDGPHVLVDGEPSRPWDVAHVQRHLADVWGEAVEQVERTVWQNFMSLLAAIKLTSKAE